MDETSVQPATPPLSNGRSFDMLSAMKSLVLLLAAGALCGQSVPVVGPGALQLNTPGSYNTATGANASPS